MVRVARFATVASMIAVFATPLRAHADEPNASARSTTVSSTSSPADRGEEPRRSAKPQHREHARPQSHEEESSPPERAQPENPAHEEPAPGKPPSVPRSPVTYRRRTLFYVADDQGRGHVERARLASTSLRAALEEPSPAASGAARVEIRNVATATAALYVRGYFVVALHPEDAEANGFASLTEHTRSLAEGLDLFVADQTRRATLQDFALRAFIALFIAVAALLAVRMLRYLFSRIDDLLDDRRVFFRPITILQVPIVSSETLGAALAFALAIGRVAAYLFVGIVATVLILTQFEPTRVVVDTTLAWASVPLLRAFEGFVGAIPGIVLALGLVVGLKGALRVIRLLLDGVATGRASWPGVTADRVPVLRTILPIIVVLIVAPLIVAAIFGRYDTPLEEVLLATSGAVAVASVPLLSTAAVGLGVLWRGSIRPGDWIEAGSVTGLVRSITPWEIVVETKAGARASIPMLALVVRPVNTRPNPPRRKIELSVARTKPARELVEIVERVVRSAREGCACAVTGFSLDAVRLSIELPPSGANDEHAILLALFEAGDRGDIQLIEARTDEARSS